MMSLTAQTITTALPLISVSGLASSRAQDRQAVGDALRAACLDTGFFYCVDHGIPQGLIDEVFAETRHLFSLNDAQKEALNKAHSSCSRGFEPMRNQTLEAGAPPDLKEGFYIGPEMPEPGPETSSLTRQWTGPNQWPADQIGFRPTMMAYFAAMTILSERLLNGLALSLCLPEDYFSGFCHDPIATLRLLHYPPQPTNALPGEKGAGAHTDFGTLTLLLQDDNGGLQVRGSNGEWLHAPPVPGSFVVNLGDMIARWTNDRYRSTLHRVVNTSGRERYSVPFFYTGNPDFDVTCLPGCLEPGDEPRYPTIKVAEHMRAMYARTYGMGSGAGK